MPGLPGIVFTWKWAGRRHFRTTGIGGIFKITLLYEDGANSHTAACRTRVPCPMVRPVAAEEDADAPAAHPHPDGRRPDGRGPDPSCDRGDDAAERLLRPDPRTLYRHRQGLHRRLEGKDG